VKERTDEQLMQAVAGGDLNAFKALVLRYQSLAWKTAYRLLGDSMEAEDAAQEAFLKLLEAAPRYRSIASFRTYFYRILIHLCIDRSRRIPLDNITDVPDIPDPALDAVERLIARERQAELREMLDALPPNQRAALILRHYEGLSYGEIAQILSVTPKAVEGLISRARASLQAFLSHL